MKMKQAELAELYNNRDMEPRLVGGPGLYTPEHA